MDRREIWSDKSIELAHPTIDPVKARSTCGEHFSNEPETPIKNPVIDAICNRKSIRLFKPDPISEEVLWTVLEAARWAPSGADRQPWYVIVINDPEKKRRMYELSLLIRRKGTIESRIPRELTQFADRFTRVSRPRMQDLQRALQQPAAKRKRGRFDARAWEAPIHLLVIGQRYNSGTMSCDINLAMENMLIAAVSLGLGTVILGAPRRAPGTSKKDPTRMMYDLLNIPVKDYRIAGWICMGYPDQSPKHRPRFFIQDKVFFNKWGNWNEMMRPKRPKRYLVFPEYATY